MHDLFMEFGRSIVDHEVFFFDDVLSVFVEELVQLGTGKAAIWVEVEKEKDCASEHFGERAVEGPNS